MMQTPGRPKYTIPFLTLCSAMTLALALGGCAELKDPTPVSPCAPTTLPKIEAGSSGAAYVFAPDPMVGANSSTISPTSLQLDSARSQITLERLSGTGVLTGQYVDVRNRLTCKDNYGAYDTKNQFLYSHSDFRFQEAMFYHFVDEYRKETDSAGYPSTKTALTAYAHCGQSNDAYYTRVPGTSIESVCLGDSTSFQDASFSDDAMVIIHETQHGVTSYAYSSTQELGVFPYDEAGALNEALSDFMALIHFEATTPTSIDVGIFSRWALGTFFSSNEVRGARRCPQYDSAYDEDCTNYKSNAAGFSAEQNTISYNYPDGLGWPYAKNYVGPGYVRSAFLMSNTQESIHANGAIVTGALWDIYLALKQSRSDDALLAETLSLRLTMETLRQAPKPTLSNPAPVNFRKFFKTLLDVAQQTSMGLSATEQTTIRNLLIERGLEETSNTVPATWASVGNGATGTPGVRIIDEPRTLNGWGINASTLTRNGLVEPGEVFAIWFDIKNTSIQTAGDILVTATSADHDITFLDSNSAITGSNEAQVHYGKINGTDIVPALASSNVSLGITVGNSYFTTNPKYPNTARTALFAQAKGSAAHGKTVTIQVKVQASNAVLVDGEPAIQTLSFPVVIQ